MDITEKEVKETEAKTYAYFSSVIAGILCSHILVYLYQFFFELDEYLTYHNIDDDYGGKLHDADIVSVSFFGGLSIVLIFVLFFVIRFWLRRIKCIEKRTPAIVILSILFLLSIPVLGYISFWIIALFSH